MTQLTNEGHQLYIYIYMNVAKTFDLNGWYSTYRCYKFYQVFLTQCPNGSQRNTRLLRLTFSWQPWCRYRINVDF